MPKEFKESDIVKHDDSYHRIYADQSELIYNPLPWQKRGLMQTATGYGKKLTTAYMIKLGNRIYRIYCCIFSNNGTCFITRRGQEIIIS